MKLINTVDSTELDVKKYPMPTKGTAGTAKINGEVVDTLSTSGRGNEYTYFRLKNVDLYVKGKLDAEVDFTLELPEGFGSDTPPAARKSYYVRKRPAKAAEGEAAVPAEGEQVATPEGDAAPTEQVAESNPLDGVESTPEEVVAGEPSESPRKRSRK